MSHRFRATAITALGALLLAAIVALLGSPAQARPDGSHAAFHRTDAGTASAQARVRAYWTKARMRAAIPKVVHGRPRPDVAAGKPKVVKGKPGPVTDGFIGGAWTGGGAVVKTTGKVFFTEGKTNYVCSGSSAGSKNGSTVTTAGHCVNEGPGAYVTNFVFVPAYDHGSQPYGKWVATALATTDQWRTAGDFDYDVGLAKVAALNGRTLSATVGSQSVGFNLPRGQFTYSFGYPAARPYDGTTLDYCSSTTTNDTTGGSQDQRLVCNMTGGSSGGPWFVGFDKANGTGTQISINSFGYTGEKNAMYGPYFGSVIQSLYTAFSAS
jgi:hypothetical protein